MAKKIENDCLTKTDVKKFFGELGTGIFLIALVITSSIGIITCVTTAFNWMDKPSKVEILSDKVDDLQHEVRLEGAHVHTFYGNDPIVYYTIHSHDATH
jgi:hypothetical protein